MDRLRTDVVAAVAMSVRSGSAPCRPRTTAFEHSDGLTQNRRPRLRASPDASTTTTRFFDALEHRPRGSKAGARRPALGRGWAAPWIGRRRQPVFVGEGSYIYGEALDSNFRPYLLSGRTSEAKNDCNKKSTPLDKTTSKQPVLTSRDVARPDVRLRFVLALQPAHRSNIGRRLLPRHA